MARNGSGTYVLPAGQPVVTNTLISSTVFNTFTNDVANALTTSVCTDGQTPMTGNLPMGTKKIVNMGSGTVSTDGATYGQLTTGLTNAQTAIQARNFLLNGQMRLASNSTSSNVSTTAYSGSLNNWTSLSNSASVGAIFNQVAVTGGTYQYMAKLGRNNGDATAAVLTMAQSLQTAVSYPLAGQTVVLSFIALAGANFSAASSNITVKIYTGTGTDQTTASMLAGTWTGSATPLSTTQAITTSAVRYTFSVAIPSTVAQVGVSIAYTTAGTAGADDNLYITQAQLEIAQNGQTTASSFEQLKYSDDVQTSAGVTGANQNFIINGGFRVAQSSSTYALTTSTAYSGLDNWFALGGVGVAGSFNQVASTYTGASFMGQLGRTAASSSTAILEFGQVLETVNSVPFAGKTVIFSYVLQAGANFSQASNQLTITLYTGTGTDQSSVNMVAGSWTGQTATISATQKLTTTATRYFVTGAIPSNATQIGIIFAYTPSGTAGAADYVNVTNVKLEIAKPGQLLPSDYEPTTYQQDLLSCQRYRQVYGQAAGYTGIGAFISTSQAKIPIIFSTPFRATPTYALGGTLSNLTLDDYIAATSAVTALTCSPGSPYAAVMLVTGTGTPYTANRPAALFSNSTACPLVFTAGL